tara:strand:+ start:642 stop:1364 length:723 start_codon:yes stop_codon:yes gene_type:complete
MKINWLSIYSQTLQTLLLPVLLFQGWKLRKNTIELPEATGDRQGTIGKGCKLGLIFLGDSSACGVGVSRLNEALSGGLLNILSQKYSCVWEVFAKSKLMTRELTALISKQDDRKFDIAIVCIGMNDITDGKSVEAWMRDISNLREIIIEKYNVSKLIFSGIPPVHKLTQVPHPLLHLLSLKAFIFGKALRKFCEKNSECCFVDIDLPVSCQTMAVDGFHPNEVFYHAWAKRISQPILKQT